MAALLLFEYKSAANSTFNTMMKQQGYEQLGYGEKGAEENGGIEISADLVLL